MPNTYTQLHVQLVFSTHQRQPLVSEALRERLEQYLCGIARTHEHKVLAIYCMPDHLHLLVGLHPGQSIAELVRVLKSNSSKWLNEQRLLPQRFAWQRGYGAFSYARSQVAAVVDYIRNQPARHARRTFIEEYLAFLVKAGIEFDPRYVFD